MNAFVLGDPASIARARKIAEGVFGEEWEAKGEGIYEDGEGDKEKGRSLVWGIGQ
jgi:alpha-mannosidase